MEDAEQLRHAIDTNNLEAVRTLLTRNPALHCAPMGYGGDGPLTWVAECRTPREPPGPARLSIARWMIENGSDVHQGGDGPLMRAALGDRLSMMKLLVAHGADVNASWHGHYPIVFAPCETLEPVTLKWLLEHGADPNPRPDTALDFVIGTYLRSPERLQTCIETLLRAGGTTKYDVPPVLAILRGRNHSLAALIDADPSLPAQRFAQLDFGATGERRLTLKGATLLHVAAEYGSVEAAKILLERGADINARAAVNAEGVGGQTAVFHAATQFDDAGLSMTKLLLERGSDLAVRARLPGHYERADEIVECTPLGYALCFPGGERETVRVLRQYGGRA